VEEINFVLGSQRDLMKMWVVLERLMMLIRSSATTEIVFFSWTVYLFILLTLSVPV
jgi:hypothetical protein